MADLQVLWCQALCCLKAGDTASHRQLCDKIHATLRNLGPKLGANFVDDLIMIATLGPEDGRDWRGPLALSQIMLDRLAKFAAPAFQKEPEAKRRLSLLASRGAALYRAGRHAEARACLEPVAGAGVVRTWAFLAMAQHRLGQTTQARQ